MMTGDLRSRVVCVGLVVLGALELPSCGGSDKGTPSGMAGAAGNALAGGGEQSQGTAGSSDSHAGTSSRSGSGGSSAGGEEQAGEAGASVAGSSPTAGNGGAANTAGSSGVAGSAGSGNGGTSGTAGAANGGIAGASAGSAGGGGAPQGPAPLGLVTFFDAATTQCPSGWTRESDADGRLLLPTTNPAMVGATSGTRLSNEEDRTHFHTFTVQVQLGTQKIAASSGNYAAVAIGGDAMVSGNTDSSTLHLPYKELLACKLTTDLAQGDGFPAAAVGHFETQTCPTGWTVHTPADGNIMMPAPLTSGAIVNPNPQHSHTVQLAIDIKTQGVSAASGSSYPVANQGLVYGSGPSDPATGNLPTMTLLACRKSTAPAAGATVPSGVLTFLDNDTCPSSWERYTDGDGRFLVAAGLGASIGTNFGSGPLSSGELRMHSHSLTGESTFLPVYTDTTAGNTAGYGVAGIHTFGASTQFASGTPPRIELRQCRKQ